MSPATAKKPDRFKVKKYTRKNKRKEEKENYQLKHLGRELVSEKSEALFSRNRSPCRYRSLKFQWSNRHCNIVKQGRKIGP